MINRSFKEFKFQHRNKKNQIIYTSKKVYNEKHIHLKDNNVRLNNTEAIRCFFYSHDLILKF